MLNLDTVKTLCNDFFAADGLLLSCSEVSNMDSENHQEGEDGIHPDGTKDMVTCELICEPHVKSELDAKSATSTGIQPKLQSGQPQLSPKKTNSSHGYTAVTMSNSRMSTARLLSSTQLISTNSFSRCAKKVTDKGITFEIKAAPKKEVSSSSAVVPAAPSASETSTSFQRTFYVPPGEDVQKATEKVIGQITAELNKQAASKLALGHTPDKETVIEITRIAAPTEGYFSRESVQKLSDISNSKYLNLGEKNVTLLTLNSEKSARETPPHTSVVKVERSATPLLPAQLKQETSSGVALPGSNDQVKISGSNVHFKTKINQTAITMPLLSKFGAPHSTVASSNKQPVQVIIPQMRNVSSGQTVNQPPKLVSTATMQNGRVQTVIKPIMSVDTAPTNSKPPLQSHPIVKTEISQKVSCVEVKQEPSATTTLSHVETKQPSVHTVTLSTAGVMQDSKGE